VTATGDTTRSFCSSEAYCSNPVGLLQNASADANDMALSLLCSKPALFEPRSATIFGMLIRRFVSAVRLAAAALNLRRRVAMVLLPLIERAGPGERGGVRGGDGGRKAVWTGACGGSGE
jgi:hypothetical protein